MTETQLRRKVVALLTNWVGLKESDGSFQAILDIYNSYSPLPRGVKMLPSYAWCAATVSAVFIDAELTDIGFVECSCGKMIELYKAKGRWMETDSYKPAIGDLVMYDWQDGSNYASTDNKGAPEHVGMVVGVSGDKLKVIEGNYKDAVGYRSLTVNGKYIRGYCLPDYASKATETETKSETKTETKTEVKKPATTIKVDYAKEGPYKPYAKVWTVTANSGLRLRRGAGTTKGVIRTLPYNEKVTCYGFYTKVTGTHWLLVKTQDGQTGFCAKQYLK